MEKNKNFLKRNNFIKGEECNNKTRLTMLVTSNNLWNATYLLHRSQGL